MGLLDKLMQMKTDHDTLQAVPCGGCPCAGVSKESKSGGEFFQQIRGAGH